MIIEFGKENETVRVRLLDLETLSSEELIEMDDWCEDMWKTDGTKHYVSPDGNYTTFVGPHAEQNALLFKLKFNI